MASIKQIDNAAIKKCDELVSEHPDVWYCLDGYRALIWLTKWSQPGGQPKYEITKELKCIQLMPYSFDAFKEEHLRVAWISGCYTDRQLRDNYWQDYASYCQDHHMLSECK